MLPALPVRRKKLAQRPRAVPTRCTLATMPPREVGARPRWPDLVIVLAIVALTVVGVAALFGSSIRAWFFPAAESPTAAPRTGRAL
jgi:hypothetical protein